MSVGLAPALGQVISPQTEVAEKGAVIATQTTPRKTLACEINGIMDMAYIRELKAIDISSK
jgi:hypothetical protein